MDILKDVEIPFEDLRRPAKIAYACGACGTVFLTNELQAFVRDGKLLLGVTCPRCGKRTIVRSGVYM